MGKKEMTGEETNVDSSPPTINHESQAPAASNTGNCTHGKGEHIHPPIYWNPFNKVYQCHKCGKVFVPDSQLAQLQERNGELEAINAQMQIDNSRGTYTPLHEADRRRLRALNADLEKRNDALELRHGRNQMAMFELESKLKTAEDKLAEIAKAVDFEQWKAREMRTTKGEAGENSVTPRKPNALKNTNFQA